MNHQVLAGDLVKEQNMNTMTMVRECLPYLDYNQARPLIDQNMNTHTMNHPLLSRLSNKSIENLMDIIKE